MTQALPAPIRMALRVRHAVLSALAVALSGCIVQAGAQSSDGYAAQAYENPTSGDDGYVDSGTVEYQASQPPPPLPEYDQPPCPEDGYLWTPGYWGWAGADYYWVPGTWVQPPQVGVLWTPGYWAFMGGAYRFHRGYWGPHVGFYGGVNYGFGYTGDGFAGGAWRGNRYAYNRAVTNVNVTVIHNTYNTTVINNLSSRVSYNGGTGGNRARPSQQQREWSREQHNAPTPVQQQHSRQAEQDPSLFARSNGGRPAIAATPKPATFNGPGVVGARGAGRFAPDRPQPAAAGQQAPSFQGQPVDQGARNPQQPPGFQQSPRNQTQPDDRGQHGFQLSPRNSPSGEQGQRNVQAQPGLPPPRRDESQDQGQRTFQPPSRVQQPPAAQPPQSPQPQQPPPAAVQSRAQNHAERPVNRQAPNPQAQGSPDRKRDQDREHPRKRGDDDKR